MRQLLQNLIGNGLKFHREGVPPRVEVRGALVEGPEGGPFCHLTVSDNGIGFEPEYAERIFGVFRRLHTRDEYGGTGIGLATCKQIVDRHGGSIAAEGRPGRGSTFTVLLPATQGEEGRR
jgi:signal transduction histidine kinase